MAVLKKKIGFIGAGNMAEAMISALIETATIAPGDIFISDIDSNRLTHLASGYGIKPVSGNLELVKHSNIVIFAIKPQHVDAVLTDLTGQNAFITPENRKLFVSIAAGIRIETYEKVVYSGKPVSERNLMPIVRVMPNTPALVQAGMCAVSPNSMATGEDIDLTVRILSAMGKVMVFEEEKMDAITAISGSGPAYCFYMIESIIEAGERLGLSPQDVAILTVTTFAGALRLLEAKDESPESLRRKVTSPGGTTEAAIRALESHHFKAAVSAAITAAAERSRQLSGGK